MSQYPPTHLWPTAPQDQDQELRSKIVYSPIRAAVNDFHVSFLRDPCIQKFCNMIMFGGLKDTAQEQLCKTFELIKHAQIRRYRAAVLAGDETRAAGILCNPHQLFHAALNNSRPQLQLVAIRRSGTVYQVPRPISKEKATFLALRWFREYGRDKNPKETFVDRLSEELIRASKNEGHVVRQKQELHQKCEANRAYAHYVFV